MKSRAKNVIAYKKNKPPKKRPKADKEKVIRCAIQFAVAVLICTVGIILTWVLAPDQSDSTTSSTTGSILSFEKESYLTGYKTRSRTRAILTLDNGKEFKFPYKLLREYFQQSGSDFESLAREATGKHAEIRCHQHNAASLVSLSIEGKTIVSYDVSNQAYMEGKICVTIGIVMFCSLVALFVWTRIPVSYFAKRRKQAKKRKALAQKNTMRSDAKRRSP